MFLNFLNHKAFGLDISDTSIELVALEGSTDNPKLSALGRLELPAGLIEDGKILKEGELAGFVRKIVQNPKFGRLTTNKFIFSLPESRSLIHFSELKNDVKSQVAENFPYLPDELYFDYQVSKDKQMFLIAVPRQIVNDYLKLFKDCRIEPLVFETESVSLGRVFAEGQSGTFLLCDIGARTTNFNIFDRGVLKFSFSLAIAGNRFDKAIADKLVITPLAAEKIKMKTGLADREDVSLILQKEIQLIIEEIIKISNYSKEKIGEAVKKIILVGGSSVLPGIPDYLAENIGLPVEIGDPWVKINIDILKRKEYFKEALEINPVLYSTVIGSAFRGLERNPEKSGINLLSRSK